MTNGIALLSTFYLYSDTTPYVVVHTSVTLLVHPRMSLQRDIIHMCTLCYSITAGKYPLPLIMASVMYACVCTCMWVCVYTCTYACTHACMCMRVCVCVCGYVYMYVCMHTCMYVCVGGWVCVHVRMHAHMHVCVCVCVGWYVYMYMCMRVHVCGVKLYSFMYYNVHKYTICIMHALRYICMMV